MTALPDLRPCSPDDLAACIALFESNVPDDFGARERTDCLAGIDEEGTRYFVLEDAGGALLDCGGYAAHPRAGTAGLVWGMIRRDLHGPGPGTRLLAARSARIRAQGRFNCVLVETTPMSQGFFARFGFAVERVEADGFGGGYDLVEMELSL